MNYKPGQRIIYNNKEVELVQLRYTEARGESWICQYLQDGEYYIIYLEHDKGEEDARENESGD